MTVAVILHLFVEWSKGRKLWHVKENGNNSFHKLHLYLLLTLHLLSLFSVWTTIIGHFRIHIVPEYKY